MSQKEKDESKNDKAESRKELMNALSSEYQHGIEDSRHIDNKAYKLGFC